MKKPISFQKERLLSLDAYRGMTMFLLMAEAASVYAVLSDYFMEGSFAYSIVEQFHHHPWNGLRFWDLIQPFFMFIVGVAMPFSLRSRLKKGETWNDAFRHILKRCFLLFLFGTGLHCIYSDAIVFELWNVLTQLSFTILVAFLLMRLPAKTQLIASFAILLLAEMLYRTYDPVTPFVKAQNFGSWLDVVLMGKTNGGGGWVTINCLSTAAHTIWGVVAGQLLMSNKSITAKIKYLIISGVIGLVLGYGLDVLGITPIIKRIATTSFVLASGGWALLSLAFFYWLVDVKGVKSWTNFFMIVGSNSIFIYLFGETIGHEWLSDTARIFVKGFLDLFNFSEGMIDIFNGFFVLGLMWYLCYYLYKNRVFIKI